MKKFLIILTVIVSAFVFAGCSNLGGRSESGNDDPFMGYTSDPCGSLTEATIFYNSTNDVPCYCDGAGDDLRFDASTSCF